MKINLLLTRLYLTTIFSFSCSFANPWFQSLETAQKDVMIMAPGLFSSKLIRQFSRQSHVRFRLIINPEYLGYPDLIVDELPSNVSLKIVDSGGLIPHSMAVIDSKLLLFGGHLISDEENLQFEPLIIEDPVQILKISAQFNSLWDQIVSEDSAELIAQHKKTIREATSVTNSEPPAKQIRYVASKNSKIFHAEGSPTAIRIKPANRVYFDSWTEATASGRTPSKKLAK